MYFLYIWLIVGVFFFWFINYEEELRKRVESMPQLQVLVICIICSLPMVVIVILEEIVDWYKGEKNG